MAKTLVDYALKNGSRDNTSVMILKFAWELINNYIYVDIKIIENV